MIFLSYSNADLPSALIIKRTLEAGGVRCWKAPEDIQPGERWAAAIVRAIRESTVMVIVVSERSMSSPEVAKELALAMSRRLTIIPLRIEEAELTDEWAYHFATIQWLDAFGGRLEAVCQRLVQNFAATMAAATVMEVVPQSKTSGAAFPAADDDTAAVSVPRILPISRRAPDDAIDWSMMDLPLPQVWWWEHLNTISDATVEKGETAASDSRTGRHQKLWAEVTAWLADLSRIALGPEPWKNNPSQFQQGKLSYTYWARISPVDGRDFLGDGLHIGVQLSKNGAKWTNGIDADVGVAPSQAVMALWASTNDRSIARMVNEQSILETYGWVQQETLLANPELHTGLVRDRRGRLMRAQTYLARLERSEAGSNATGCTLWSPLITIDDVRSDPARVSVVVAEYLRILAEPVRVARAMVVPPAEDRTARERPVRPESPLSLEAQVKPVSNSFAGDIPPELRALAERLSTGDSASLTIRELLSWFGVKRRGSQVVLRVTAALEVLITEGHDGLRTLQDVLETTGIDDTILLDGKTPARQTDSMPLPSGVARHESEPDEKPDGGGLDLSAFLVALAQQAGFIPAGATGHVVRGRPTLISAVAGTATVAEVQRILASDDIEVDACDTSPDAYSATHFAAWDGKVALLEVLLDAGAAIEIVARDGFTQLSLASTNGHTSCVALLLERGSPVDTRIMAANRYSGIAGGTPLRDAVLNQHWDIVDLLLEAGADIAVLAEPCQGSPGGHADFFDAIQYEAYQGAMRTKLNVERTQTLAAAVRGSDGSETDAGKSVGEDDDSDDADTDTVLYVDWGDVGLVLTVAFSPDGTRLATGSTDNTIHLADAGCGALLTTLTGHEDFVRRVRFSPDGRWLASASDDMTVRLWDAETGEARGTVRAHEDYVYGLAFSPDARRIVSGSADKTVRIWEVESLSLLRTLLGHEAQIQSVACSPDGRWIASGDTDGRLCIWDAASGDLQQQLDVSDAIFCVSFNEDGTLLAVCGERAMAEIFDTSSWAKRYSLSDANSDLRNDIGSVYSLAFMGIWAVIGSKSSSVVLWEYPTDAMPDDDRFDRLTGHLAKVNEIVVTVDGTFMASVSDDSMVRVWRIQDASVVWVANYWSVEESEAESEPDDSDESDEGLDTVDQILQSLTTREVDDIGRVLRNLGVPSGEEEAEDEEDAPAKAEPVVSASANEQWRENWWSGSERWEDDTDDPYADIQTMLVHPSDVVDVMAAARRLTASEVALIAARIRTFKVIPVLTFFPTRPEMKNTIWFHPLIVVAERFGSVVAVDKNGCYCAAGNDGDDLSIGAPFSPLISHELEQLTPYLWRLTLSYDESGEQYTTLDEYVPAGAGAYLALLDAILEVNMPVVEASRDVPFWNHGAGGETWKAFESWDAMLGAAANWGSSDAEDATDEASDEDAPDGGDADEAELQPLYALSPALRMIVGATPLSSTEIITRVWAYIKYFGLQDAANMRLIIPDALLTPVMDGNTAVMMSEMAGYLRKHMTRVSSS
jgi:WD40 repeat protein